MSQVINFSIFMKPGPVLLGKGFDPSTKVCTYAFSAKGTTDIGTPDSGDFYPLTGKLEKSSEKSGYPYVIRGSYLVSQILRQKGSIAYCFTVASIEINDFNEITFFTAGKTTYAVKAVNSGTSFGAMNETPEIYITVELKDTLGFGHLDTAVTSLDKVEGTSCISPTDYCKSASGKNNPRCQWCLFLDGQKIPPGISPNTMVDKSICHSLYNGFPDTRIGCFNEDTPVFIEETPTMPSCPGIVSGFIPAKVEKTTQIPTKNPSRFQCSYEISSPCLKDTVQANAAQTVFRAPRSISCPKGTGGKICSGNGTCNTSTSACQCNFNWSGTACDAKKGCISSCSGKVCGSSDGCSGICSNCSVCNCLSGQKCGIGNKCQNIKGKKSGVQLVNEWWFWVAIGGGVLVLGIIIFAIAFSYRKRK